MTWLQANLGKRCLAPLTGTDAKALTAAIHIIELYSYHREDQVLVAFRNIIMCMQETTRELAYHAIAHVMDWSDRNEIWCRAGLSTFSFPLRRCAFEPK
jgi:hypothetical protein